MTNNRFPGEPSRRRRSGAERVRADRFTWSEEEAMVIFGTAGQGQVQRTKQFGGDGATMIARILVSGRRGEHARDVRSALEAARDAVTDRFVVLERSGQHFMQCLCLDDGWVLEKREGDDLTHFRAAVVPDAASGGEEERGSALTQDPASPIDDPYLDFGQVLDAMRCYHEERPEPSWLRWKRIEVS